MGSISRRDFVKGAAAIAAGVYGGTAAGIANAGMMGGGMGGGGMGGGGSVPSVIDPPVGPLFLDPPVAPSIAGGPGSGLVDVALDCSLAPVNVNGTAATLWTYNGQFPGPTIRAATTDLLRVRFSNSLPMSDATNMLGHPLYPTNLHTHGLHVTPGDNMNGTHGDNMMVMVEPGEETVYEYDLSKQYPGTLNFYHPHLHGSVADQMWGGMAGCLVVEDAPEPAANLAGIETHLMVLKDIDIVNGAPRPHSSQMDYMHGLEGQTVMVNGQLNPRLYIAPGQVQRWRIVNASVARFYKLSLASHKMYLIGTEAGLLKTPYQLSEILVSPGERVDILVQATATSGSYKFRSLSYSRGGMSALQTVTLATVTYRGSKVKQSLPSVIDPDAMRMTMDTSMLPKKSIALSMGHGAGYINGVQFTSMDHTYTAMSELGTHEVWEITNATGMDHPFHQHVNAAQVLSISGGDADYARLWTTLPAMKDVVIVPKMGSIKLLMPVMDYEGMTMFHCHIIEHEDIGMMGAWHIMGDGMPPMPM